MQNFHLFLQRQRTGAFIGVLFFKLSKKAKITANYKGFHNSDSSFFFILVSEGGNSYCVCSKVNIPVWY